MVSVVVSIVIVVIIIVYLLRSPGRTEVWSVDRPGSADEGVPERSKDKHRCRCLGLDCRVVWLIGNSQSVSPSRELPAVISRERGTVGNAPSGPDRDRVIHENMAVLNRISIRIKQKQNKVRVYCQFAVVVEAGRDVRP